MARKRSAQSERDGVPSAKRIHEHWLAKVGGDNDVAAWIGENAYDNIMCELEVCYACGREAKLQRCHIRPHSLGGSDTDVDNYFLMCMDCHQNNPDTIYTKLFWHYIRNRPQYLNVFATDVYTIITSLFAESTEEEKDAFMKFAKLPVREQTAHHLNIPLEAMTVSLNSRMSTHTGVGAMFMNAIEYGTRQLPDLAPSQ